MFGHTRTTKLQNDIRDLEGMRDRKTDEIRKVKDELAELKQTKKMEDENIRHLVKIKLPRPRPGPRSTSCAGAARR